MLVVRASDDWEETPKIVSFYLLSKQLADIFQAHITCQTLCKALGVQR